MFMGFLSWPLKDTISLVLTIITTKDMLGHCSMCTSIHIPLDIRGNVGNRTNRQEFGGTAKRRHLITKQNVANLRRKVCDQAFMKHSDDASISTHDGE